MPLSNEYDAHRDLPSYAYAMAHKEFALRPSLPLLNNARPAMLTPPSSPQKVFGTTTCQRKRKASQMTTPPPVEIQKKPKKEESENVKKLKTSPALKHLSIFTHAAFAEEEECQRSVKALNEAFEDASVEDVEMESLETGSSYSPTSSSEAELRHPRPLSAKRIDLDVLLSNLPSESPYPPTPRSMAMRPLSFSSTIPLSSAFSSCSSMSPTSTVSSSFSSSSPSFGANDLDDEEEYHIKEDLSTRLGLGSIGLGIADISIFSSSAPEEASTVPRGISARGGDKDSQSSRARMTAVIHTAQGMAWSCKDATLYYSKSRSSI